MHWWDFEPEDAWQRRVHRWFPRVAGAMAAVTLPAALLAAAAPWEWLKALATGVGLIPLALLVWVFYGPVRR